jgi:hypothetical protein
VSFLNWKSHLSRTSFASLGLIENSRFGDPGLQGFPLWVDILAIPRPCSHPCFERSSDQLMRSPISKLPHLVSSSRLSRLPDPSLYQCQCSSVGHIQPLVGLQEPQGVISRNLGRPSRLVGNRFTMSQPSSLPPQLLDLKQMSVLFSFVILNNQVVLI